MGRLGGIAVGGGGGGWRGRGGWGTLSECRKHEGRSQAGPKGCKLDVRAARRVPTILVEAKIG